MELMKNIFFNTDKLTQNSTVKLSYTGKLFTDGSEEVYLHLGFGLLWENLQEIKMEKTELGFQAEINLITSDTFNFCLRNEKHEWDNNNSQNYIFSLEKLETDLVVQNEIHLAPRKNLSKTYIWSKRLRLALYKIITFVPRIISGNYKRKLNKGGET